MAQCVAIAPCPKPRQTARDKWQRRPAVVRYRAFADAVRRAGLVVPESGCHLVFLLPMPSSWSKKRRTEMIGQPHRQKPDLDNLVKALLDAVHDDDSGVWKLSAEKRWSESGGITIREL